MQNSIGNILSRYKNEYLRLLKLGAPILVTQLSVIVLAFTDTIMVGRYSVGSLAASAFVNSLFLVPNVMLMGLAAGVTPLVGALYSRGDRSRAGRATRAAMWVNTIVALVFTLIMAVIYFNLDSFGQEPRLLPQIRSYYLVLLLTPLPIALYGVLMQTANGVEHPSLPMYITLFAIGFNILFNWLLIYGVGIFPELGLLGAGVATVMARYICLVGMWIAFRTLRRFRDYHAGYCHTRRLGRMRWRVWATSWPVMLQNGCECALWSAGGVVVGWFGAIQLAAYQVVNTIGQLGFMIYTSFAAAVAIRVAFYAGQRDEKGAGITTRAGLHINFVLATIASIVFIFAGEWLVHIFVHAEPGAAEGQAVVASALTLIMPLVFYQYFDASQLTLCNAIRGTGQVRPLFSISFVSYILTGIPALLIMVKVLDGGNTGAYWSFNIALGVATLMAAFIFKKIRFNKPNL